MRQLPWPICIGMLVSLACAGAAEPNSAAAAAVPAELVRAQIAVRFDPLRQCPELRVADADEENVAVVVFAVGSTGVPSQAVIRTAARADGLDAASKDCVLKLRFQPAVRWGDGAPIESWQQIAWKWAPAHARQAAGGAPPATASAPGVPPASTLSAQPGSVAVRVCVTAAGKVVGDPTVVRPSGDPAFDAAALQIARAGSGSYRAADSGCLELSIKPAGE